VGGARERQQGKRGRKDTSPYVHDGIVADLESSLLGDVAWIGFE
jgi:hypothetical protein